MLKSQSLSEICTTRKNEPMFSKIYSKKFGNPSRIPQEKELQIKLPKYKETPNRSNKYEGYPDRINWELPKKKGNENHFNRN